MLSFKVDDMTCGHCVSSITKAVAAIDKAAVVTADLSQHLVHVRPTEADAHEVRDAIAEAGYTPVPMEAGDGAAVKPVRSGCCCGTGVGRCG